MPTAVDDRIERLSQVSAKRVLEPDEAVSGGFTQPQVVPDELLITHSAGLHLSAEQKSRLAREQTAALLDGGIRLESVLLSGFGMLLATWPDLTDPRVEYMLHELGEETRHSRLFARMIAQLEPSAVNPFHHGPAALVTRAIYRLICRHPLLLCVMVLAGEEIPDLIQRRAIDHPDTDDYLRRANVYHREEEARHIAFAGMLLPELWAKAGWWQRLLVRRAAPLLINLMLETQMYHPGVFETVGLPARRTARRVYRSPGYREQRASGTRPVLKALRTASDGGFGVPRPWRRMCAVRRDGTPAAI
jgi:hypothetical protein